LGSATQWLKCTLSLDHLKKDSILHLLSSPKRMWVSSSWNPSAEFAHHTPLISSDVVDEDGARAVVISESSHSPGGCCDLLKEYNLNHACPSSLYMKQANPRRKCIFLSFCNFLCSKLNFVSIQNLLKCNHNNNNNNACNVPDQSTLTPTSLFYHYLLWMWVASYQKQEHTTDPRGYEGDS
jgi:hypothetical protein